MMACRHHVLTMVLRHREAVGWPAHGAICAAPRRELRTSYRLRTRAAAVWAGSGLEPKTARRFRAGGFPANGPSAWLLPRSMELAFHARPDRNLRRHLTTRKCAS